MLRMANFLPQPQALINILYPNSAPSLTFDVRYFISFLVNCEAEKRLTVSVYSVMDPTKLPGVYLSKIPALFPPNGVESNFFNPYSIGPRLTTLSAIFLALMCLCVLIRFYTKIFIKHSWGLDDCESASY